MDQARARRGKEHTFEIRVIRPYTTLQWVGFLNKESPPRRHLAAKTRRKTGQIYFGQFGAFNPVPQMENWETPPPLPGR